jgi:putative peptidoglycan lipid II flippase
MSIEQAPATAALREKTPASRGLSLLREAVAGGVLTRMFQSFMTVASLTLVAKSISFFKEAAVARHFGIADELDAFVLSFTLLSFLSAMLGGAMPDSFLPVFTRLLHRQGAESAHRLGLQLAVCSTAAFVFVGVLLGVAAGPVVRFMGHGFSAEKQIHAARMLRDMLPFFIGSGLIFHLAAWLRAQKSFVLATIAPAAAPAVIIFTLAAAGSAAPIEVLVNATNLGVLLQLLLLAFALRHTLPRGRNWAAGCLRRWEPDSTEVLRNTLPFLLAGVVIGSAPVIDQIMAAWLEPGSVAVLGYSEKITSILLALTAVPACEAMFPFFADAVARREWTALRRHLLQVTGVILVAIIPLTLLMCWFAPFIVHLLFERGAFSAENTERVALVLRFSVFQVPFYIASSLASRLAVSMQASRFMLGMAAFSLSINVICNALLMRILGVAGIALSTVIVHLGAALGIYAFVLIRIRQRIRQEVSS